MNIFAANLPSNSIERRNILWYTLNGTLFGIAMVFYSNILVQTYLVNIGLANSQIGLIGFFGNAALSVGTFFFMGISDKIKNDFKVVTFCNLLYCLSPICLTLIGLLKILNITTNINIGIILCILIAAGLVQNVVAALYNIMYNRIFIKIVSCNIFGKVCALAGAVISIVSVAAGALSTRFVNASGFPGGFIINFAIAALLFIISSLFISQLKSLIPQVNHDDGKDMGKKSSLEIIKKLFMLTEFKKLAVPNVLRGLVNGCVYFVMSVGITRLSLEYSSHLVLGNTVAAILGNIAFGIIVNKLKIGKICFIGNIIAAFALLNLALTSNRNIFLLFNFILFFGQSFIDQGVPVGIYQIVPSEIMGAFTGGRFLLMTGGTAISTYIIGNLLDKVNILFIFTIVASIQVVAGYLFWRGFKQSGSTSTVNIYVNNENNFGEGVNNG